MARTFGDTRRINLLLPTICCAMMLLVGCGQADKAEAERARAEAEQARAELELVKQRLDVLEPKSTRAISHSTIVSARPTAPDSSPVASLPIPRPSAPRPPSPGTLAVQMLLQGDIMGRTSGQTGFGPWLFIDGRLVRDYGQRPSAFDVFETLSLTPGDYLVELVIAGVGITSSDQTPFTIRSRRIKIEADKQESLVESFPLLRLYSGLEHQSPQFLPLECRGFGRLQQNRAEQTIAQCKNDPLAIALRTLDATLANRADKRVAWLEIPDAYGGAREVNAALVRYLVDWLQYRYWSDWPTDFGYSLDLRYDGDVQAEQTAAAFALKTAKQCQQETEQLKNAARKLELGRE